MLRQFVSSTRAGEDGDPLQETLWIYTPDYDYNGEIKSIQNITTARGSYSKYWKDLDQIKLIEKDKFTEATRDLTPQQVQGLQSWLTFD